jgi:endonuclease-3
MIRLSEKTIHHIIRTCGLAPSKAKAIAELSQVLVSKYAGQVPRTFEELESLRGVGHKTASVVMVQGFGVPAFPVDTHIHRLAGRWNLSRAKNVVETERDLKKLFAQEHWGKVHLQFIYFGREHCPARSHDFSSCPICSWAASKARVATEVRR